MNLTDAQKSGKPRKYAFPRGRGHGSGLGKTCGKGHKGQNSRSGVSRRAYFEGGQMPNVRRLPKRGFNNAVFKTDYEIVNVGDLEKAFEAGAAVDAEALRKAGLIRRSADGVKVLGGGELTKKLTVKAEAFTKGAEEKIAKAGGAIERLAPAKEEAPAKTDKK